MRHSAVFVSAFSVLFFLSASLTGHTAVQKSISVTISAADGTERSFSVPAENAAAGLSVATADLGKDGKPEILLGNGHGMEPRVRVYSGDGIEIGSFLAYGPEMTAGINLAACDLTGDGKSEIIVVPQRGAGPHIRIFDNFGTPIDEGGFFAYAGTYGGGVNLACGDLDGDGAAELVTLPAVTGGPHIRIWKWTDGAVTLRKEFFAFEATHRDGLIGMVSNGRLTIMEQRPANARSKTYLLNQTPKAMSEQAYETNGGNASLVTIDGELHIASLDSLISISKPARNLPTGFGSAATVAADLDGDGAMELIMVPSRPMTIGDRTGKTIVVDLSEQRLYAYADGVLDRTFLISSARSPWETPVGEHRVTAKKPYVHYRWSYGPNNPNNYDLGLVPYNLQFYPHIYIHYAYWHNNFGNPMSRGCVNVDMNNMKWVYDWAHEGIPVIVRK